MSSADAGEVGEEIERLVCERKGWEREEAEHYDARNDAGDPVEIKACREWTSNGDHRTRGRWWIQRGNHERLVAAEGWYCMVVYAGPADEPEILSAALVPAGWIEDYPGEWHTTAGHHTAQEARKIRNDRVVAINGGESA